MKFDRIPYGRQHIDRKDISAVEAVMDSDFITQGPKVSEFEVDLANYCGAKYAVAVSTGTAALHLACLAAGIKSGDEVITSPVTFLATANSILYTGAKPVFADIEYNTVNISPDEIEKKINGRTKAIMPVHFAGLPCEMARISGLARKNKLIVIEDACHALGAEYFYKGAWVRVGSCQHSDMAVFSFHPVKSITTGEGGAITTNSRVLYMKLLSLRSHGIYKNKKTAAFGGWYYEMRDLGYNYRLTDMQAALGITQLKKLRSFLKLRRQIALIYNRELGMMPDLVKLPVQDNGNLRSSWHLYVLKLNLKKISLTRKEFYDALHRNNIGAQVHYIPIYKQPFYKKLGYGGKYPISEAYYKEALSLPIYPGLSDLQLKYIIRTVKKLLWPSIRK